MFEYLPVLASDVLFGLSAALTKTTIGQSGRKKAIVYMYIFLTLLLFAGALILGLPFSFPQDLLLPYLAQIAVGAIAVIAFFKAIESGKVGILAPLSNLYVIFVIIFGMLFFSESVALMQMAGMLIILAAGAFIAFANVKKLEFEKGVLYLVITIFGWGYYYSFIKIFVVALGPYMCALFLELGVTVLVTGYYLVRKADLSLPKFSQSKSIFLRSSMVYLGTLLNNISIILIGVILSAGVAAAQPLFDIFFVHFLLKERLSPQKYIAVLVMVLGLILVFIL
ncbi:MAG: DMT family transporter [Candidatus Micrarchaeia archaeon]